MLKYLEQLCCLPGVSGDEGRVSDLIIDLAVNKCHADSVRRDIMGNVIVEKKGSAPSDVRLPKLELTAHMDEVGFIVTRIEANGYVKFETVGGIDRRVVLGRRVFIGHDMVPGVIGLKAFHMVSAAEEKKAPGFDQMYIDIGASSKAEAEKKIALGDYIVFDSDFLRFGTDRIKAKAIDDRWGCALMLELMSRDQPMDITYVFSVQEEVGCRGAYGSAFSVEPDIALILEGASCSDIPTIPEGQRITVVGAGPVIGCVDGSTIYDRGLFYLLSGLAEQAGIPWQVKNRIAGGTDASVVQRSREGVRAANISVGVRNIHSPSTIAGISDIENAAKLAQLFIEAVAAGKAQ